MEGLDGQERLLPEKVNISVSHRQREIILWSGYTLRRYACRIPVLVLTVDHLI